MRVDLEARLDAIEKLSRETHLTMIDMAILLEKLASRIIALEARTEGRNGYKH